MLAAIGLGWWWFGDQANLPTLAGTTLIVGAELYLWQAGAHEALPIKG